MQDMDDEQGAAVDETTADRMRSKDKPRGKCTGCAFDYQLGTARTGEHKGKLVIRKHNSRTGPGLCSGAQKPPEPTYEELEGANTSQHGEDLTAAYSPQEDPNEESEPVRQLRLAGAFDPGDVVGVAPGGMPIVAAPTDLVGAITLPPHTALAPDAQITMAPGINPYVPVMPPVSISEVHAENPPRPIVQRDPDVLAPDPWSAPVIHPPTTPMLDTGTMQVSQQPRVTVLEYGSAAPAPDPWSAPAPASDIPESTTTVSGQPEPDRDRWGRYLIMGTAHTRATTFAKLGANTKAIEAWNERNVIRGLTLRPDLLMLANGLEVKRDRNDLNSIASQAKDAAGSKVAANIGTAYHAFSERLDAGLMSLDQVPEQYRNRVRQYGVAVARAGLTTRPEWIERTTAVRADQIGAPLPVAGTLDRIFQLPDGSLVIGDLKTGSDLSYGEMEIEVQLALYAHGVNTHGLFDWNTKTWEDVYSETGVRVRTDIAIVVHLPADGDGCTLYVADIERGWRDAQRLGPLQASLKEKKRFRTLTAADLAPRPEPVSDPPVTPEQADADDVWERAKRMFSEASSQADVASLYQFAMDSGRFHKDQLAVLVVLGKDRLNELARG